MVVSSEIPKHGYSNPSQPHRDCNRRRSPRSAGHSIFSSIQEINEDEGEEKTTEQEEIERRHLSFTAKHESFREDVALLATSSPSSSSLFSSSSSSLSSSSSSLAYYDASTFHAFTAAAPQNWRDSVSVYPSATLMLSITLLLLLLPPILPPLPPPPPVLMLVPVLILICLIWTAITVNTKIVSSQSRSRNRHA
ncbi:hypothetical protein KP509_32G066100 [Ceratopteris richardii]|uniref:Uncharacterized protein n=1 Tax=Ceratopteris richardii TaxID=49495 RepID=A0A8T2QW85_CERRI|nr:hypothetical protein KP509_32G065900 [Ceratopteris richardii]KAH7287615.1 hypothetical protein KP509_32G066100 [Ceratopteris richardii]